MKWSILKTKDSEETLLYQQMYKILHKGRKIGAYEA
mgnify:CR=1 FL=1